MTDRIIHLAGRASCPIESGLPPSRELDAVAARHGSWLLPRAFPEGAALHPSCASGHATVAGACVTFLKRWFDEPFVIPDPVLAGSAGMRLEPWGAWRRSPCVESRTG